MKKAMALLILTVIYASCLICLPLLLRVRVSLSSDCKELGVL